ncbi:MAG: glycogen synthase GlgA [Desulfotomaculum sp.]|nr:glycogen synthase GlgA [Desulfotomaculum sp.]
MNVLFVASEAAPFVKTGGLGDVIGSLPQALASQKINVQVILPKHQEIPAEYKEDIVKLKKEFTVPVGWRNQYCGLEKLKRKKIYLIDNQYYFNRRGLYGHFDDAERYAFFCRAVLEALPHLNDLPDIIHCHDWQTGPISLFLKTHYYQKKMYQKMRTVFTIHNLRHQGVFPKEVLEDILDLGDQYLITEALGFFGKVNFMKGGLSFADAITTVSKTYAQEIQTAYFGEQLDGALRYRRQDLYGILNGIDDQEYNPATDKYIFNAYDLKSVAKKQNNKEKLQRKLNLPVRADVPLLAIVSRLVDQKGLALIEHVLPDILALDLQLVVLGTGDAKYEYLFKWMAEQYPDKLSANIFFEDTLAHQIYAGSDLFLMPSLFEPCGLGQLIALRYGSLPIVRETGGLKDTVQSYNEVTGTGNGFSFTNFNAHDMLATIKRAVDYFHQKETWSKIVANAMSGDYSWRKSAQDYLKLYKQVL